MTNCSDYGLEDDLYMSVMHSLSIIALFMNLFAFYCIVCKSTRQMGAYKWYLLAYQASSTVFDIVYTGFVIPVIYFPVPMGYPGSWLAIRLCISGYAAGVTVFLTCSLLTGCILNLFNYRCHIVTPNHHISKISENGHIYKSLAVSLTYFISLAAGLIDVLPDQEVAKIWVMKVYRCAYSEINDPRLTIFTLDNGFRMAITVIVLAIIAFGLIALWIILTFHFIRMSGNLSQKTKQMQKRFLVYLCVQVAIPILSMLIPILTLAYVIGAGTNEGGLGNYALAMIGSHGCVSSLSVVMCNEPYRNYVIGPLINLWRRRKSRLSKIPEITISTQCTTIKDTRDHNFYTMSSAVMNKVYTPQNSSD